MVAHVHVYHRYTVCGGTGTCNYILICTQYSPSMVETGWTTLGEGGGGGGGG